MGFYIISNVFLNHLNSFLSGFLVAGAVVALKDHNNLCRDLTDYGDLTFIDETVQVCDYKKEKKCEDKTVTDCMVVTELQCKVELFTNCTTTWENVTVSESKPATLYKTLPTCTKQYRTEEHEKIHYDCNTVKKNQCTTLWKVVDGEKVWAGLDEDDCKEVEWEECKEKPVTVEWEVPYMNCTNETYPYTSFENTPTEVMVDTMKCEVLKRAVCEPVTEERCDSITYTTCSEEPVQECKPMTVPCPSKDKIHKQWCLFNQGETAGRAEVPSDDVEDEVFQTEAQGKNGRTNSPKFNWIINQQ